MGNKRKVYKTPNYKFKRYLKRLRNYDLFVLAAFIAVIPLDILLHFHGQDDFDIEELLTGTPFNAIADRDFIPEALFDFSVIATTVSAFSYYGRAVDIATDEKTILHKMIKDVNEELPLEDNKHRNRASVAGLFIGLALSLSLAILLAQYGEFSAALLLTEFVGMLAITSASSGLGSRVGQVFDRNAKGKTLNRNYELAIIGSLLLSLIPIAFTILHSLAMPYSPILGFTAFITAAILLPSTLTSIGHYIGLGLDFLTKENTIYSACLFAYDYMTGADTFTMTNEQMLARENRCNEKIATLVGLAVGFALGLSLLASGIFMPAFLVALPFALKAPLLVLFTMNMCASISSRIGRHMDRAGVSGEESLELVENKPAKQESKSTAKETDSLLRFNKDGYNRYGFLGHNLVTPYPTNQLPTDFTITKRKSLFAN